MKNYIKGLGYCLLAGLASCSTDTIGQVDPENSSSTGANTTITINDTITEVSPVRKKKIKLAILLDTSGSMEGLIEQTKNQLWKIVNQLAKAKDINGNDPEIELALYQYGNDGISAMDGYVQQISAFTTELDEISEQLFALRTNGGSEFCGTAIKLSISDLEWSSNPEDLQFIFIAGNEPFSQGGVDYRSSCTLADERNVIVNTIFCGNYNEGVRTYWEHGAQLGNGKYMNINSDAKIIHYSSPYDSKIVVLNTQLNNTYIPYGRTGNDKKQKQINEDVNASGYGQANAVKRYVSKGSKVYKNTSWDLVDASDKVGFDINTIKEASLPAEMQGMSNADKLHYIADYKQKRYLIKSEIKALNKKREIHVANEKAKAVVPSDNQLDNAIIATLIAQAKAKSYYFEN
jgi:hypothetical protein